MRWDGVEREFVVIAAQLERLSKSFAVLAWELCRERENATHRGYEGRESPEVNLGNRSGVAPEGALLDPEDRA